MLSVLIVLQYKILPDSNNPVSIHLICMIVGINVFMYKDCFLGGLKKSMLLQSVLCSPYSISFSYFDNG